MSVAIVCFLLLGKQPAPPNVFDGVRAGMAVSEAKLTTWSADPGYKDGANRTRLVKDAGNGAKYYVLVANEVVSRIGVEAPAKALVPRLHKLWGAPETATNLANEAITSWSNGAWRADLSCRGELCRMAFHQTLTAGYFGAQPQPPGVLAGLRPGMTRTEIQQLAPRYLAGDVPAGPEDVRVSVDVAKSGHVRGVLVSGLPGNAKDVLEKAWGKSVETTDGAVWFNAERGWRAQYVEGLATVQLTGYIPASKILGGGPGIALLAKPILGATPDKITAAYPTMAKRDGKRLVIELPPSEGGTGRLVLGFDNLQRANKMTIELPYDTDARRDELLKLMSTKWGNPTPRSASLVFPTDKVKIEVTDGAKRLDVAIALP
ncbi:MAG TPA: hypothetical protein VK427_08305 [Kofleriaceae bacterium]|nr:hypothetical protein [Kofleriaceae bacterium]